MHQCSPGNKYRIDLLFRKGNFVMKRNNDETYDFSVSNETSPKLYKYLSIAIFAGAFACLVSYCFPDLYNSDESLRASLEAGVVLFILGMLTFLAQLLTNEKVKQVIIVLLILVTIPFLTLLFVEYASVTIWVFPLVLLTGSLIFNSWLPMALITVVAAATQILVWYQAPTLPVHLDQFDYIFRMSIFFLAFFVGIYVNRTYLKKMKENKYQINFQKLISELSVDFVDINKDNFDGKINSMLERVGLFFNMDRTLVSLINEREGIIVNNYKWCNRGLVHETEMNRKVPLETIPWWMDELRNNKLIHIHDVNELPFKASVEKYLLARQGVKSTIAIAIEIDEAIQGFMRLDSIGTTAKWSEYHFALLQIVAHMLTDVLIKIKSEKEIEYMAYYDHLTNLPNRTLFTERLTQAIHLAKRNEKFLGIIFLDLDGFKMVNDTMGHSGGDVILKEVAQNLTLHLRKIDTTARFGGDEFLIMINNLDDGKNITTVVDSIMKIFAEPFFINDHEFYITASAGVAVYPCDGDDAESLIKNADIAMYSAKSKGKNQYVLCTTDMKAEVKKNIYLSNQLYRVQQRDELAVYYQPQIKLSTGEIVGLEALLRWRHPEMGMIPPSVFIPLAEMNGTINGIGEWVLKTAIGQNKKWQDLGFPNLRMSVNLSVVQFNNPNFVDSVEAILKKTDLDPKYLELEITESVATKEATHVIEALNRLKQLGISVAIDDFGTEYSSLNRLKALPIDRIKIDMQFIHGIEGSAKDQAITKIIINLAKGLGLKVIAEGVETLSQLEFLNQKMCDEVQGFYYYKPMPAHEIEALLRNISLLTGGEIISS
jgi:diguanylate cyclase (GGDEF)-like protein